MKKSKRVVRDEDTREFRRYRARIDQIVNECSLLARNLYGWNIQQWAEHADISDQSIYNLITRKTRYPRFHTIYQLAKAVGAEVWVKELKGRKVKVPA